MTEKGVTCYVLISTEPGMEKEVFSQLDTLKNVNELYALFGEYDIITKIDAKDSDYARDFVERTIKKIKGVQNTETLMGL